MKIAQLMTRLEALYPFGTPEAIASAAADYRAVLGRHEGGDLQRAWDATIAEWRKGIRPLPADIAAHLPKVERRGDYAVPNWLDVKLRHHALVTDWWSYNTDEAEGFIAQFEHDDRDQQLGIIGPDNWRDHMNAGATDRICARGKLADLVDRLHWREAQFQIAGRAPRAINLTRDDYDRIRGQVHTQRQAYPKRRVELFGYADAREMSGGDWTKRARFVPRPAEEVETA